MYIIYGILNCNSVKKALDWLDAHQVSYHFHNYKKEGITAERLKNWSSQKGWQLFLNKKGTTWKALHPDIQAATTTERKAIALMVQNPSMIKRPVIELEGKLITVGFDATQYESLF